jgi:D-xylonolactonase
VLGEGPIWLAAEQALYWLDIKGLALNRFDPASGAVERWPTPYKVGAIAPRAAGGFVAATETGFVMVDTPGGEWRMLADPEPHLPGNRFNDGKVDTAGRFWAGSMDNSEADASGSFYRLDPEGSWTTVRTGYRVPNGPTFSPDGRWLYHTDSALSTIYRFAPGPDGSLGEPTVFAHFDHADGYPDGMTTDAEGHLWVAFWDGWCVRRLSPDGKVVATVELPVQRPTSCAFGGPNLDRLFVTSAAIGLDASALAVQPLAGGLFMGDVGVRGLPATPFGG